MKLLKWSEAERDPPQAALQESPALPSPEDAAEDAASLAGDWIYCWFLERIFSNGSISFQGNLAQYLFAHCVSFCSALGEAAESRSDLQSISPHPLPMVAVPGHTKAEEEEAAVICFKAMTAFPSNLQGEDGERFPGASPDKELCNVKCIKDYTGKA